MELYLMRHGIAVEGLGGKWRSDGERPLSKEGIHETERAARGLAGAGILFDRIFSSPLARARQTAELVAAAAEHGSATGGGRSRVRLAGAGAAGRNGLPEEPAPPPGAGHGRPVVEELEALSPGLAPMELMKIVSRRLRRPPSFPVDSEEVPNGRRRRGSPPASPAESFPAEGATRPAQDAPRVLLVGHEPDMGLLAAWLLDLPGGHSLPFARGTIARIDVDGIPPERAGRLLWLLTAPMAGRLGR